MRPRGDTGGDIVRREMDFFVVSDDNFRTTRNALSAVIPVTPLVEQPPRAHPGVD